MNQTLKATLFFIIPGTFFLNACSVGNTKQTEASTLNEDREEEPQGSGETCESSEVCLEICKKIYLSFIGRTHCEREEDTRVYKLKKVYHLILLEDKKGKSKTHEALQDDLTSILEDQKGVEIKDFQNYVKNGGLAWIANIENANSRIDKEKLVLLLEWIIENDTITQALSSAKDGLKILEALVLKLAKLLPDFNKNLIASIPSSPLKGLSSGTLTVGSKRVSGFDADLYVALSGAYLYQKRHNIFTFSTESGNYSTDNKVFFEMAFDLLEQACENYSDTEEDKKELLCMKYFACWTSLLDTNSSTYDLVSIISSPVMDMFEDYKDELEYEYTDSGTSKTARYYNCDTPDFDNL